MAWPHGQSAEPHLSFASGVGGLWSVSWGPAMNAEERLRRELETTLRASLQRVMEAVSAVVDSVAAGQVDESSAGTDSDAA